MKIEKVSLYNYRNFEKEEVLLHPEVNVLRGKNAQGKTNFLEAIYLFSTGKSYRAAGEKELIRFDCDRFKLCMDFYIGQTPYHGVYSVSRDEKRDVSFNHVPVTKQFLLSEHFKTVLFCPEELEIIKGEKELRRALLDEAICLLRPHYAKIMKDYQKCVRQKNRLLRTAAFLGDSRVLDVWNQHMAEYGARCMMHRGSFTRLLESYSAPYMEELTGGKEQLSLRYLPSFVSDNTDDVAYLKERFYETLCRIKQAEIERGQALSGPHRDDLEFLINGKNARLFSSQGQQRSIILCIKLAMADIVKDRTGYFPVLLLDDIMSELDKKRQSFLTEKIKGKQTVITCTGAGGLRKSKHVSFFTVEQGKIIKDE